MIRSSRLMLFMGIVMLFLCGCTANVSVPDNGVPVAIPVPSEDYHYHTSMTIGTNNYDSIYWDRTDGDGVYGEFEVTSPSSGADQIVDFFICDQANYDLYTGGQSASVYHLQDDVPSYTFEFIVPATGTWYFVWINQALFISKTVSIDLYLDQTSPAIDMNLDAGATYSGIKEITAVITEASFEIDTVELYIDSVLKDTEYDGSFSYSWNTVSYSNGAHNVRIWASDNVGNSGYEEVLVYASNAVATSTTTTTTTATGNGQSGQPLQLSLPLLGGVIAVVAVISVAAVMMRRKKSPTGPSRMAEGGGPTVPPATEGGAVTTKIVTERVLIVCPFCGSKNEQGVRTCQKCGAAL